MHRKHLGSCQFGRVTFEVEAALDWIMECNCSACRRKGALWHGASESNLHILSGESESDPQPARTFQDTPE